jgi:iron complex transport system substrate-binding protein
MTSCQQTSMNKLVFTVIVGLKRCFAIVVSSILLTTLSACQSPSDSTAAGNNVISITSKDITYPLLPNAVARGGGKAKNLQGKTVGVLDPTRVALLAAGAGDIVHALGFSALVVARDITQQLPVYDTVPIVTDAHSLSLERLLSTLPTLVVVDSMIGTTSSLEQVEDLGIQVVMLSEIDRLADIDNRIRAIAEIFGDRSRGDILLAETNLDLPEVSAPIRVLFLYLRGNSAIYLVGGRGSGADMLLESINAIDVGSEFDIRGFTPIQAEVIRQMNPDAILVMKKGLSSVGGVEGLVKLPGLDRTKAAINQAVIVVDDDILLARGIGTYSLLAKLSVELSKLALL